MRICFTSTKYRVLPQIAGKAAVVFCALFAVCTGHIWGQDNIISASSIARSNTSPMIFRRLSLNSRGDNNINVSFEAYPNDPNRGILVLTGGLNLIIEGITANNVLASGIIDISADNAVVWMTNPSKLSSGSSHQEVDSNDFEVYLEGNIVYRDGPRVIQAAKMYYDAKNKVAYVLDGNLTAPITGVKGIEGAVRLKADILRQLGDGIFTAKNTLVTTSQLGEPTYSLHSRTLTLQTAPQTQGANSAQQPDKAVITAENNYIAVRNTPIFYWPWMSTDVQDPTFYLKRISYGNSGVNGHTLKTLWNPFQILNCRNKPDWLDGDVNVTWMSKRGIGYGTSLKYTPPVFFHIPGQTGGSFDFWGLYDDGLDRLGGERKAVGFDNKYRYRLHWVHEQEIEAWDNIGGTSLEGPVTLRAEVGKVSDRNFLNSYFNSQWNTEDNATTAVDLKKICGNQSATLSAEYALDKAYSNANWFPRFDHYWIGKDLCRDALTWYEHSRIGIADFNRADMPNDTVDQTYFQYLPWETNSAKTGLVFSTRHEVDLPVSLGPVRVIPYVLGDFSAWGSNQYGNPQERLYGQGGVRLNLPFWKVRPNCSSRLWYLNGLAHKVDVDVEYFYAQANRSMDSLILTDAMDNWSIDDFRRRYSVTNEFFNSRGGIPAAFDPRYYALRSGFASNVTAGNMEVADDLQLLRTGMTHRFQTKRGSVGHRHIVDWITVSAHVNFYPQAEQNFGRSAGLLDYSGVWNIGDRFSLFSEALYDFFESGQSITRIGGVWNRPDRGNVSVMLDEFSGAVERTYLTMQVGYAMNEKYSMSYSTSYNIRDRWKNVGHNLLCIRTGESFRLAAGAVYSEALSQWSFSFGIEPVFLQSRKSRLTQ
jgi:hypothetical protein